MIGLLREEEVGELAHAARLFGELLLFELDEERFAWLEAPLLRRALLELGVELPRRSADPKQRAAVIETLAAEFYTTLLSPTYGAPPIASLWSEGRYEGEPAQRLRALAAAASIEFDARVARDAPIDHLGCVLLLWAHAAEHAPAVADALAVEHLAWAHRPLDRIAQGEGFYAELAAALRSLIATLEEVRCAEGEPVSS